MAVRTILQINTVVNTGSTGRIAEQIGKAVLAAGGRSVIAFGRNPRPSASELIRIGSDSDVYAHALRTRIFDDAGFGSRRATEKFLAQVDAIAPDIVHLHNLHGYYVHIGALFRYLAARDVPVVWTLHDCWAFTGHCAYPADSGCDGLLRGCTACPQKRSYPSSLVFSRSRRNFERKRALFSSVKNLTLVSVSDWLAGEARRSFLGGKRIVRIYNGIDTATFSPKSRECGIAVRRKYGLDEKAFTALACATAWSAQRKNLAAYCRLRELVPAGELQLVLVGLTEAQRRVLPEGIVGIARTESTEELAELYSAADVVLNLSLVESLGTTTLEGLACGTPGIVLNCTGSPEELSAETGFVVPAGDFSALTDALSAIRSRGKAAFSAACRERALSFFRAEDRWGDYLKLYAGVAAGA